MIELIAGFLAIALIAQFAVFIAERRREQSVWQQERNEWAAERVTLLNRIQAPEIAAIPEFPERQDLAYVAPDDDESFAALQEDRTR